MSLFEIIGLFILGGLLCYAIARMIVLGLSMRREADEHIQDLRRQREQNLALCRRL